MPVLVERGIGRQLVRKASVLVYFLDPGWKMQIVGSLCNRLDYGTTLMAVKMRLMVVLGPKMITDAVAVTTPLGPTT